MAPAWWRSRSRPTVERGQWYFQRYVQHLPTTGEIVLFDRSWYNRAGVERVMGFCHRAEVAEFLRQVPEFERNLTRSGVHLIKFWFSVSQDEQRRRFTERERHPLKQWKLSPIDLASLEHVGRLHRGQERHVPGHRHRRGALDGGQVRTDKKRARLNAMRYVLHRMPYSGKDLDEIGLLDPLLVGRASDVYETGERLSSTSDGPLPV